MKKRWVSLWVTLAVWSAAVPVGAQQVLNNEAIVKMVKAGLAEELIVSTIQSQPGSYSLGADDLIALKSAGVSDKILAAMLAKSTARTTSPAPAAKEDPPFEAPVKEVGVYYKKGGEWVELLPEVVNWRTGGVLKNIATAGLVKGDINGFILGPNSRNSVKSPVEILIYAPEGVAITEYQLLRLRQKGDKREFRTVTGGILHASGGATRDLVPFEGKKIAPRTWVVILPNLGAGEYGFLAPGAVATQHAGAQLGKMYTFRLLE
jgi:hypothetical protein